MGCDQFVRHVFLSVRWEISVPSNQNSPKATPQLVSITGLTTSFNRQKPSKFYYIQAQQPSKFTPVTLMFSPWDKKRARWILAC